VVRRAFFVTGDQVGHFALVVRVIGDETLGGDNHRRQAAFHVRRATAAEHAVFVDQRAERIILPGLNRAGRHHIGVTGEAQHRTVLTAVGGPEVVHVLNAHRLQGKTGIAQAFHHHGLAISVQWCDGWATDQVAGELQRGREVGWGCHERSEILSEGKA
jgi:hypothetical protein